jgi:hypothetical protein
MTLPDFSSPLDPEGEDPDFVRSDLFSDTALKSAYGALDEDDKQRLRDYPAQVAKATSADTWKPHRS